MHKHVLKEPNGLTYPRP